MKKLRSFLLLIMVLSIINTACTDKDAMETTNRQQSEEHSSPDAEW